MLLMSQLAQGELVYLSKRRNQTQAHIRDLLRRWNITLSNQEDIKVGIAISGGGYRAMLSGAGVLAAFDKRTPGAATHLGGLLQGSTYMAGISGGLWIVMRMYVNGGKPVLDTVKRQVSALQLPVLPGIPDMDVSEVRLKLDSQTGSTNVHRRFQTPRDSWNASISSQKPLTPWITSLFLDSKSKNTTMDYRRIINFYKELVFEVRPKRLAGFPVSFVDYWGRALLRKIAPVHKAGGEVQFSSPKLQNSLTPFPIICTVERDPNTTEDFTDSHVFEFTPFEFGSWDSFLALFVDLRYFGTKMAKGEPVQRSPRTNSSLCVKGYDNIAFITGTTSSLFNTLILYVHKLLFTLESEPSALVSLLLQMFGISLISESKHIQHTEYSVVSPNPFYLLSTGGRGRSISNVKSLYLADGGDDGQNIPFHPLLVPYRHLDVIFALDCTSDLHNYPNGTSIVRTAKRYHSTKSSLAIPVFHHGNITQSVFPRVPTEEEFAARNLRGGPVFLGCEISTDYPQVEPSQIEGTSSSQYETWPDYTPPLIIYTANTDYSFASNTSTFKATYTKVEVDAMVQNGYNVATSGNSTEYMSCVACALIKRSYGRQNLPLPQNCNDCFAKYCYQ